jgi:hypothetical protein
MVFCLPAKRAAGGRSKMEIFNLVESVGPGLVPNIPSLPTANFKAGEIYWGPASGEGVRVPY